MFQAMYVWCMSYYDDTSIYTDMLW